jgi:transposase
MLYVGLDLSRKRLDYHALRSDGTTLAVDAVPPDAGGLRMLVRRFEPEPVVAAIESMNGARFVHDQLELSGWQVEIADAVKVKGLAPLACKTDRIDARVLAELCWRQLVPVIWLPDPGVREERERARFRLHLVRHRTSLKNRVHATLLTHGIACPVSDLFGVRGRALLERLPLPSPWRATLEASIRLIDDLDREIDTCERELQRLGADHRYVPLLLSLPGLGWVLAYTIAAEIGSIERFARQKWSALSALGADRGDQPRLPPPGLRRPLHGDEAAAGQATRTESRPCPTRPHTRARDLAHAHP